MAPYGIGSPEARSVAQAPAGARKAWCSSSLACYRPPPAPAGASRRLR